MESSPSNTTLLKPTAVSKLSENLATYLEKHIEDILIAWRKAVDGDERLVAASRLKKLEFEDSISISLKLLIDQLREGRGFTQEGSADGNEDANWADKKESNLAHDHGLHRWQEGYEIDELILEWGHLHICVLRFYNDFEAKYPDLDHEAMGLARVKLAQLINGGFSQSVGEYHRLQQTEAKEIVNSLSEALRQVSEWERTRGQVLREVVHDLRGNLSAVQAATSLLNITTDTNNHNTVVDVLQRGTEKLHKMLSDLLDLARLESGQEQRVVAPFDAALLIRDLCEVTSPLANTKNLYLKYDGPQILNIEGDETKVQRIAQNLLLNALKYTSQGGVIVTWGVSEPNQWYLTIEDSGPGLSTNPESDFVHQLVQNDLALQKSSTPTEHTPLHGEGVGLAIVKRLCTLLQAQLAVETEPEKGTLFRITFPRCY
jgi:signal transduction histidine kinase